MKKNTWTRFPADQTPHELWNTDETVAAALATSQPHERALWKDPKSPWNVCHYLLVPIHDKNGTGEYRFYVLIQQGSVTSVRDITVGWSWTKSPTDFTKETQGEVFETLASEILSR
ncbi:MAG: hypothetical protein LBE25_09465 [Arthrobacter sp.]|jgi:hypothetical protein|nr:hypothetical protein [Arthrobacter sp.]